MHCRLLIYRPSAFASPLSGRPGAPCWAGAALRSHAAARPLAAGPGSARACVASLWGQSPGLTWLLGNLAPSSGCRDPGPSGVCSPGAPRPQWESGMHPPRRRGRQAPPSSGPPRPAWTSSIWGGGLWATQSPPRPSPAPKPAGSRIRPCSVTD